MDTQNVINMLVVLDFSTGKVHYFRRLEPEKAEEFVLKTFEDKEVSWMLANEVIDHIETPYQGSSID